MKNKKLLVISLILVMLLSLSLYACNDDPITYGEWEVVNLPTDIAEGKLKRLGSDNKEYFYTLPNLMSDLYVIKTINPTCTDKGSKSYTLKVEGTDYTFTIDLPKLGHDYEVSYLWSEDGKTCTAKRVCKRDNSHVETETVTATSNVTIEPTCSEMGTTTYTATFKNDWAGTQTTTRKDQEIVETNHAFGDPTYTWNEDYSEVTAKRVCIYNKEHVEEVKSIGVTVSVNEMPTFSAKGKVKYVASFADGFDWAEKDAYVIKEDLPILNDVDYILTETDVEPTVDKVGSGSYTYKVLNQDLVITGDIEKLSKLNIYINGVLSGDFIGYTKSKGVVNTSGIETIVNKTNDGFISYKIYVDQNLTTELTNITELTKNKTTENIYIAKSYTLSYETLGGTNVANQTIQYNDTYKSIETTRAGYTLDGWYTENGDGKLITFGETKVNPSNHNIYANWIVNGLEFLEDSSEGTYGVKKYTGTEANLIIPAVYKGKKVTSLNNKSIVNNSYVTSIAFSKYINFINRMNFMNCDNLVEYKVDANNTRYWTKGNGIITNVLDDDTGETFITLYKACKSTIISEDIQAIGQHAFNGVNGIEHIVVPSNIKKIDSSAFSNMKNLRSIIIPESITFLGGNVLASCTNLTDATILCSASVFESFMRFGGCNNLINISIPATTKTMKDLVYTYQNIQKVTINSGTRICIGMFAAMYKLKEVNFSNTIISIGAQSFSDCPEIEYVVFPTSVKEIVAPPDNILRNENQIFNLNRKLKYIVIPTCMTNGTGCLCEFDINYNILVYPETPDTEWNKHSLKMDDHIQPFYQYSKDKPLTQDIEVDKAGYWHFAEDGKTPVLWEFGTKGLKYKAVADYKVVVDSLDASCTDKNIVIPHVSGMNGVAGIKSNAFSNNSNIESITFGNNITIHGLDAGSLENCPNLKTLTFNCLNNFDINLKGSGCLSVETINFSKMNSINLASFNGLSKLTTINFNGTMEEWGKVTKTGVIDPTIPVKEITCLDGKVTL